ncbi:MAG: hypothetical protein WAO22_04825 [bacterium]|jgi:hypothetical protein|nr:hypothetical protein [Bacillota bacterium]
MVTNAYARILPPEVHRYFTQFGITNKLFNNAFNPRPLTGPAKTGVCPPKKPSPGGG